MIFGIQVQPYMLIVGGTFLATLVVFQILVGLRKIHFPGKLHMRVHKMVAWLMLAGVFVHGLLAMAYLKVI